MSDVRIIPVLDLLNGITVQAVAGRRAEYRPVRSLTDSVDPSVVLRCLDDVCCSGTAYVADLDAIQGRDVNRCTLAELSQLVPELMVDAGVRSVADAESLLGLGIPRVVIGLESLPGPEVARELTAAFPSDSLVLSLDLKSGAPLTEYEPWSVLAPDALQRELSDIGFRRWIVLDLATVGTAQGVPTQNLCSQLRRHCPQDDIVTGGGIREIADLQPLSHAGVNGVLMASALHSGAIGARECSEWREPADRSDCRPE